MTYICYDVNRVVTPNQYPKYHLIPWNSLQNIRLNCWRMNLIVLGFNDTSTLVGHFVSSPREREKSDRRDSRRDEREGQGRKEQE